MSRWDALKPTESQPSRRRQRPAPSSTSQQQQQWRNDRHHGIDTTTTTQISTRRKPVSSQPRLGGEHHESTSMLESKVRALIRALAETSIETSSNTPKQNLEDFDELANLFTTSPNEQISPRTAGEAIVFLAEILEKNGTSSIKHDEKNLMEMEKKVLELMIRILVFELRWTKLQANQVVSKLTKHASSWHSGSNNEKRNDMKLLAIRCLARTVTRSASLLPAEESCATIVQQQFLPLLEQNNEKEIHVSSILDILVALKSMLLDSRLKSALLAPLVGTVTSSGDELSLENPLRARLFRAFELQLTTEAKPSTQASDLEGIAIAASECISMSLQAVVGIDGTSAKVKSQLDFRPAVLDQFLSTAVREDTSTNLRISALNLLYVALDTYPDSYGAVGGKYLFGNAVSSALASFGGQSDKQRCHFCHYQHISPLLDILHSSSVNHEEMNLATNCCSKLIQVMPLKLRLNAANDGHEYSIASPLGSKIGSSLEYLIRVCHCQVRRSRPLSVQRSCQILTALLQSIPFHSSSQGEAVAAAADFLAYLAERYMDLSTTPENCMLVADVIVASVGGKLTPQGTRTTTTIPGQIWLGRECFSGFLCYLFSSAQPRSSKYNAIGAQSLKIIKALARMQPNVIMEDDRDWESFNSLVQAHIKSTAPASMRLEGFELFLSLLCGRSEFAKEIKHARGTEVVVLEAYVLRSSLNDQGPQCRCAGLQAYGALLLDDWAEILRRSNDSLRPFMAIFDRCSRHNNIESNAGARATACKTIGDICMTCLEHQVAIENSSPTTTSHSLSTNQQKELSTLVCQRMLDALTDNNAGVKSMALFAVGNLAYALRSHSALIVPASSLVRVYELAVEAMDDKNGKVCGNAIRTVGHVGRLALLNRPFLDTVQLDRVSSLHLKTLQLLTRKVAAVVDDPSGLDSSLSWKQRSEAKKHGWGTCNSLALLLSFETFPDNDDAERSYQAVVEIIIRCIERLREMHEKISIAAIGALKAIPSSDLPRITGRSGLVGRAICCCMLQVKELRRINPDGRLLTEMEQLLRHLILSITSFDAVSVVTNAEVTKVDIEFLYSRMADHQVHAFSFQCFAVALQKSGWRGDPSLEHKFANPPCTTRMKTDDFEDEL